MRTLTVTQAKASLSQLLQDVLNGEEIAIGRRGKAEIVLSKYEPAKLAGERPLGSYDGPYRMDEDFFVADKEIEEDFENSRIFPDGTDG